MIIMKYENIGLASIMTKKEFIEFKKIFKEVAEKYSEVLGILATGSLFQDKCYFKFKELPKREINDYFYIDKRKNRNLGFKKTSDIDIWVILKDHNLPKNICEELDEKSINLIEEYKKIDLESWSRKCQEQFGEYCKNKKHYSKRWINQNNGFYWKSRRFQSEIIKLVHKRLNKFCERFNYFFDIDLDDFLEIRAFPESLLNVKLIVVNTKENRRVPIPVYLKSWLTKYNTQVLYSNKNAKIFPFKPKGIILGERIGKHFKLNKFTDEELYLGGF